MLAAQDVARHERWLRLAEDRLRADPSDLRERERAVSLSHALGRWRDAVAHGRLVLASDPGHLASLDALAHSLWMLGEHSAAVEHGREALRVRDAQIPRLPADAWPLTSPPRRFDTGSPSRNAVCVSLFGNASVYCEQAILTARELSRWLPGWHLRVYADATVPVEVLECLRLAGATIVDTTAFASEMPGTMWRFLACDEPGLDRVLLRDADAPIGEREAAAVAEWLDSDRYFHAMRDWGSHTELLLAGMWGVARGGLPPIAPWIREFARGAGAFGRFADQVFLRERIWPYARRSVLQHDSVFGFPDARPFPGGERSEDFHVGDVGRSFEVPVAYADDARVRWMLVHAERGEPVSGCRYEGSVAAGVLRGDVSVPFARAILDGRMTVLVEPVGNPASAAREAPAVRVGSDPLATFFIPVHNGEAYVTEAIESILSQRTTASFELLLVDDASSDGSAHILEQAARDPRVRLVRNPANLGVAQASNLALRLARGQYLLRLDQDDLALPDRLQWQLDFMEREPGVHVLGGNMLFFGDTPPAQSRAPNDDAAIKARLLPATDHFANPTACLRLAFFREHRLVHRPYSPPADDYGLWVDAMAAGARFANLPQVVTRYRIHRAQNSRDLDAMRAAVAPIRRRLLRHWYPDLANREVQVLEPILHGYSDVVMTAGEGRAGLAAGERALSLDDRPRYGEDRAAVRAYIEARLRVWAKLIDAAR